MDDFSLNTTIDGKPLRVVEDAEAERVLMEEERAWSRAATVCARLEASHVYEGHSAGFTAQTVWRRLHKDFPDRITREPRKMGPIIKAAAIDFGLVAIGYRQTGSHSRPQVLWGKR